MSIPSDMLGDLRAELERELSRLERSLVLGAESVKPVQLDQQSVGRLSRMDSLQNQHMSQGLRERQEARVGAIRAALRRMDEGIYGECTECGDPIDPGRLFVVPEAEHCVSCGGGRPA